MLIADMKSDYVRKCYFLEVKKFACEVYYRYSIAYFRLGVLGAVPHVRDEHVLAVAHKPSLFLLPQPCFPLEIPKL